MSRRTIAAIAAIVLAILGAVILIGYVSGAERRAMAGMEPAEVLVVTQPVSQGTPAEQLEQSVEVTTLPATAVADGAVQNLKEVEGLVTTADLLPGEQLLEARFAEPGSLGSGDVDVPEDKHQVSVLLEPQRIVGGRVGPGSTVAVYASFTDPDQTNLILHKVLVSQVQGAPAPAEPVEGEVAAEPLPENSLIVTLVVEAGQAERVVFAAEHGTLWLSLEPEDAPEGGTGVRTRENIYQ